MPRSGLKEISMHIKLLNETQASEYLGLSISTLRQGRMHGWRENRIQCPRHVKSGRSVRYKIEDLDAWIDQHLVEPQYQKAASANG